MIRRINIKDDHPPVDVAVARTIREIECSVLQKENFLKIIHGYGSGGVGGDIKKQLEIEFANLKKEKKIFDFIKGECFCDKHPLYEKIVSVAPELILDPDLSNLNSGISLIIIQKLK